MTEPRRDSDRWITPRVVVAGLFLATVVVLAGLAAITYLSARGIDPAPVLDLATQLATAVGAIGTLVLQLVTRKTTAKVERNTGQLSKSAAVLADDVYLLRDEMASRTTVYPTRPPPPE